MGISKQVCHALVSVGYKGFLFARFLPGMGMGKTTFIGKEETPVALTREEKAQLIEEYTAKVSRAEAAYIADYRGLSVKEIGDFRAEFRKAGAESELEIGKNTLFRIAFENAGWVVPTEHLEGPTAVLICYDDPGAPAKVLKDFAKKNDKVKVKGGALRTSILDAKGVEAMADLPTREEIRGTVVGTLMGPAQTLFGTITAPLREIVQVLQARADQGQEAA
jgi:large subunit ribosomal protein L10